jgi:hypothetical protein
VKLDAFAATITKNAQNFLFYLSRFACEWSKNHSANSIGTALRMQKKRIGTARKRFCRASPNGPEIAT